jgi:activator of HSP90 ATPase
MAKIGETDPRWIVAERSDGVNVGNWHWTEKDCWGWAKERLPQLFKNLVIYEEGENKITIISIDELKGEMHINTRKGKVLHFYEFTLGLKWEGQYEGEKAEGKITFPEISGENDIDEHEVRVNVTKARDDSKLRSLLLTQGLKVVRGKLGELLSEFHAMKGYLQDTSKVSTLTQAQPIVLSSSSSSTPTPTPTPTSTSTSTSAPVSSSTRSPAPATAPASASASASVPAPAPASTNLKALPKTKTVKFELDFRASSADLFAALTDPRRMEAYTQSPVVLEPRIGGKFSMFGGNISGEFLDVKSNEYIVQKWRSSSWPEGHYSTVTIKFKDTGEGMRLKLKQTGVPATEAERTQAAWRENVFERIRRMFGYGSFGAPF